MKYLRPGFFLSNIINPFLMMLGIVTVLSVKGRKSGKWIHTPITPIEYQDDFYLVAPRGETQWVRNLRHDKNGELKIKNKITLFKATEVSGEKREEVVSSYQEKVKITKSQFDSLPNPEDHPTFRIDFV